MPVEVTTCGPTETTSALLNLRLYTWTAPFVRGIDLTHQITDLLGIAVAGASGNELMGLGFPDQTIVWDAVAIENTVGALIEEQSPPTHGEPKTPAMGLDLASRWIRGNLRHKQRCHW